MIKVQLKTGTLDQNGNLLRVLYTPTKLETGVYDVELSDETGDLYLIENTKYCISFLLFYGVAIYDDGVLEVTEYGATFYKEDEY